jgi:hypothetical protein
MFVYARAVRVARQIKDRGIASHIVSLLSGQPARLVSEIAIFANWTVNGRCSMELPLVFISVRI